MEDVLFCSQCGTKLNSNAKFCHACGAKTVVQATQTTEQTQNKLANDNDVSQKLYNQYHDIVCDKVISAYCNQTKTTKNILYQNGVSYGFTSEMVDKVVAEQEQQIDKFVKYLESLYINGSLLFPDCTWKKGNECVEFGINLGFCEEESLAIYECFIEKNHLKEKNCIIFDQADFYEKTGMLKKWNSILNSYSVEDKVFYQKFVKALEKMEKFQKSLHGKSNSIELNKNDIDQLYQKAEELGFYDFSSRPYSEEDDGFDMIDKLIAGTEVKLGYTVLYNEQKLSSVIPFRTVHIMGEELCFESSYFLAEYVQNTFTSAIEKKKNLFIEVLTKQAENISDPEISEVIENCDTFLRALWEEGISALYQNLNIANTDYDEFFKDTVHQTVETWLGEMSEHFADYAKCFDMIDEVVDAKTFQNTLKSAVSGSFSGGGFGLKGAVTGAVTAAALNTGVGAFRSLVNKISEYKTNNKAEKCKILVYKKFLETVCEATESLYFLAVSFITRYFFRENSIRYMPDYKINSDKIYAEYSREEDVEKKKSLALQLLKLNCNDKKYYLLVLEHIFAETQDKIKDDMASLYKIANFFNLNLEEIVSSFVKQKENEIKSSYSRSDIKRCEALLKLEAMIGKSDIRETVFDEFFASAEEFRQKEYTVTELQEIVKSIAEYGESFSYPVEKVVVLKAKQYWKYRWQKYTDKSPKELKSLSEDIKTLCKIYPKAEKSLTTLCTTETENYIKNCEKINLKDYSFEELISVADFLKELEKEIVYSTGSLLENRIKEFSEYHVKNDCKKYSPDELSALVQLLNSVIDRFPNFKPLLDTAKEQAVEACFSHHKISSNASEQKDVEHNIERLEYFNQNCSLDFSDILNKEKAKLKKIKIRDEKESRTFNGTTYETREEANEVKNETELFEKVLNDTEKATQTFKYLKLTECEFKTEEVLQKMSEQEKNLIQHIESLHGMTKRKSSFGKLLIALIITPILAMIALMFSMPGIVIGLIVILAIWSWYNDERKECKEYNSQIAKCKAEIKEFETLFVVKEGRLEKRK